MLPENLLKCCTALVGNQVEKTIVLPPNGHLEKDGDKTAAIDITARQMLQALTLRLIWLRGHNVYLKLPSDHTYTPSAAESPPEKSSYDAFLM